jgi:hypothetical protein
MVRCVTASGFERNQCIGAQKSQWLHIESFAHG